MKKLIALFSLLVIVALAAPDLQAQQRGIGTKLLWYNYQLPESDFNWKDAVDASQESGLEVSWHNHFRGHFGYVVPLHIGVAKFPADSENRNINRQGFVGADGLLRYSIFKPTCWFVPYVQSGLGLDYRTTTNEFSPAIPFGVGLNVRLGRGFYLSAQSEYRFAFNTKQVDGLVSGLGIVFDFGPSTPVDTDGDGLPDKDDKCPTVPGIAKFMGCPDTDGDGFQDSDDKCPTVAGIAEFIGCPDSDGDGIQDSEDKCPQAAGIAAFMGCPDTDMDGIQDSEDRCPKEKGNAANKGCPDTDSDGLVDMDDKCPKEKGPKDNNGCPLADRDGDGVLDKDDLCPDKKGEARYKGCADSDGDGVADNTDKCPDKAGPASNQGCPEMKAEQKKTLEFAMRAVQFETGKSVLLAKSSKVLDEIAAILNEYPEYGLRIEGHTDNVGTDENNHTLSHDRAKSCLDYLVSKGIAAARLSSAGFGETRPVSDNKSAAGRELNRRVEFNTFLK